MLRRMRNLVREETSILFRRGKRGIPLHFRKSNVRILLKSEKREGFSWEIFLRINKRGGYGENSLALCQKRSLRTLIRKRNKSTYDPVCESPSKGGAPRKRRGGADLRSSKAFEAREV